MAPIEHLIETRTGNPPYSDRVFTPAEIAKGFHRSFIGGHWDTHGQRQVDFLQSRGLKPGDKFLDIGCGCFRAGRFLIDLLDANDYYGIDANLGLLEAGYDHELSDAQRAKLPTTNLRANDRFACHFGVQFDMAIAQSVFSHVSLNHVRLCLFRLGKQMRPGGKFYATFYEQPARTPLDKLKPSGRKMFTERNPFWYYRSDLKWAAQSAGGWSFRYIGDWGHPNGQMMVEFTRLARRTPGPSASRRRTKASKFVRRTRRRVARRIAPT